MDNVLPFCQQFRKTNIRKLSNLAIHPSRPFHKFSRTFSRPSLSSIPTFWIMQSTPTVTLTFVHVSHTSQKLSNQIVLIINFRKSLHNRSCEYFFLVMLFDMKYKTYNTRHYYTCRINTARLASFTVLCTN